LFFESGAAIAVNFATFSLMASTIVYIVHQKIYINTWTRNFFFFLDYSLIIYKGEILHQAWSYECLYDWKMYLKLAIPGLFALLIEWTNFEIGTFASASLDEDQLALMSIAQQVLFIFDQVN
jgi:hypothetical protein